MSSADDIVGNVGEWSEFYTFCYLLNAGILKTADRNLNTVSPAYLPILRITRVDNDEVSYCPKNDSRTVEIYIGHRLVNSVPKKVFEENISLIYSKLVAGGKSGVVEIPEVQQFLRDIRCTKLKADTRHKEDIEIQFHDVNTNQNPVQGFSIKSYIGSDPTLLNAGKTTNFRFQLAGCTDQIMDSVNGITEGKKIMARIGQLISSDCVFRYRGMSSEAFEKNLRMVDSMMPEILARLICIHYTTGVVKLSQAVEKLEDEDPLEFRNRGIYTYKIKTLLCSIALGMVPSKPWYGREDANGGYIVVKDDGQVVCFFLYNRNEFAQYLLDCTKFERASTSRHGYCDVVKEGDEYFIDLNLQIRFIKPGYAPRNKEIEVSLDDY